MEMRASGLLVLGLAMGACLMGLIDVRLFLPYAIAAVALVASFRVLRVRQDTGSLPLFVAGSLALVYFVRPLVLAGVPGLFMYPALGSVGAPQIAHALRWLTVLAPALVFGVIVGLRAARHRGVVSNPTTTPGRYLLRGRLIVDALLVVTLAAKAVLTLKYSVGVRGVQAETSFGFLLRLVPEALVYPVLALMLLKYRRTLTRVSVAWYTFVLFSLSALVFRQGSRIFVFELLVLLVLYSLLKRGDFRIRVPRALMISVVSALALLGSYILGTAARQIIRGRASFNDVAVLSMEPSEAHKIPGLVWFEGLWATRRLQGFDGMLAVNRQRSPQVLRAYRPTAFAERFVDQLLPMSGNGPMSTGKVVALYYSNLSPDAKTAGSLGLIGTLQLMLGRWGMLFGLFGLGVGIGIVWRCGDWIRDPDARFVFLFVTAYHVLWVVMAGSLDMIGARYVTALLQLAGLSVVMRVTTVVLKPSVDDPGGTASSHGSQGASTAHDVGLAT